MRTTILILLMVLGLTVMLTCTLLLGHALAAAPPV